MSTASAGTKPKLDNEQRNWLKLIAAALDIRLNRGAAGDIPLTGVSPELLWQQKQAAVQAADSMVKKMEAANTSKSPAFRKAIDLVRGLGQQKKFTVAVNSFNELEPKIKAEFEKLHASPGGGPAGARGAAPAPTTAAGTKAAAAVAGPKTSGGEAKKEELKKDEPSDEDKAEFELMKGAVQDGSVEAYVKHRDEVFGAGKYKDAAAEADKEFDDKGLKNIVGQAGDSIERRKVLYRWLRKAYKDAGINDPPATIKAGMTPEMKTKIDAVKAKHPGLTAGGFCVRPRKLEGKYRLGTLSEHGTGKAVDIRPEKNPQIPAAEWKWVETFTGKDIDTSKKRWLESPKDMWKDVSDLNAAYVKKLEEQIVEIEKKRAEAKAAEAKAAEAKAAEAKAAEAKAAEAKAAEAKLAEGTKAEKKAKPAPPAKVEKPSYEEVLKGNPTLIRAAKNNGVAKGFFELEESLVTDLAAEGLVWGATFSNVDLHHFEMP